MKNKVQMTMNILLIIFMPFMMYLNVGATKVNVALSDVLLLPVGILFLINIIDFFPQKRWLYLLYFTGLVLSLFLSQFISQFNDNFLHVGNSVMLIEILKTLVVAMCFFTAFMFIRNENDYKISLVALSLSSIPVIIIGGISYIYFLLGKEFFWDTYAISSSRFLGTFGDPNLCALYFIVIFFASILNFKVIKNIFLKYFMLGIGVISFICILLTMSRGGWLAFAIASVVFIALRIKNFIKKESLLIVLSVVLVVFISIDLDYVFQQGKITNDIVNRTQDSFYQGTEDVDRIQLMRAAFEMGNDNFLFGVGKGSFPLNSYMYISKNSDQYKRSSIPHNTILGFYAQQGIVGTLIFLILPIYILYAMIKYRKKQSFFLIPLFIGIFIHSMTINIENVRFIWYILGLIVAGEDINIDLDFMPTVKINKGPFNTALIALVLLFMFSYVDVSRKLAINIYTNSGATYVRKISSVKPGDYQLSFDIQTDNHLHSVEVYDGEKLIKQMNFKSAYGVVHEPIHIEKGSEVVFRSQEEGWMKVKNAFLIKDNKKVPLYNYLLIPRLLEDWFIQRGLLVYSSQQSFKEQIAVEDNKFGAFEILGGKVTKYSNLSYIYQFDIKTEKKVDKNYQLELLLDYQSISSLQPNDCQRNLLLHRFTLSPNTTKWEVEKNYTVKTPRLLTSDNFNLYGRYYDYTNAIYSQQSYFSIDYDLVKENQNNIDLGESNWINILYNKDKGNIIHMVTHGWVESGRMNLQPGDYNITFKAQGSFLEEYSKVRIRDSELNEVAEITLDGNMKEYTVQYHVDEYKSGQSFILELINYEANKNGGNRQVLLKDWLKVDRKLG